MPAISKKTTTLSKYPVLYVLFLFISVSRFAFGQLTPEDIADLQQQGKEKGWTFSVGLTEASQRPLEQLGNVRFTEEALREEEEHQMDPALLNKAGLPSRFDWRDHVSRPLPPVKDQGSCGSCWAFATTEVLEWAIKIHDDTVVDLSEQWLISCNSEILAHTCSTGGFMQLGYFKDKKDDCGSSGAVLEKDCPYTGWDSPCKCPYPHKYWIKSYSQLGTFLNIAPVEDIKAALYQYGPLGTYLKISKSLIAYTGGVYNDKKDEKAWNVPDHAVIIIGWDDSKGAWLVQNSWGTGWGMGGYGYMEYGVDLIGSSASWVIYGDDLSVSPRDLSFSAEAGSSSSIASAQNTLLLENKGTAPFSWSATAPTWLKLSANQGTIAPGTSVTLSLTLALDTVNLQPGNYSGTIFVTNQSSASVQSVPAALTLTPPVIYNFPLDSNPGWSADTGWAFGRPAGLGSYNRDPSRAYTGQYVYGYNLKGDYESDLPRRSLTTPSLDFSRASGVTLRFMRWLGVEEGQYDEAAVEVSNNGYTWITVWKNPARDEVLDTEWVECEYNLSAVADGQPNVRVRWVMGPTDYSQTYPGWNIDDIQFRGRVETEAEVEGEPEPRHPADTDNDGHFSQNEALSYISQWQKGTREMKHAVQILFIWKKGGYYRYDETKEEPYCWVPIENPGN